MTPQVIHNLQWAFFWLTWIINIQSLVILPYMNICIGWKIFYGIDIKELMLPEDPNWVAPEEN